MFETSSHRPDCVNVCVCVKRRDPMKQSLINHHYIFAASFSSKVALISLSRELHPDDPCFWWVLPPTNVATKTVSFCFMTNKSWGNTNKARNVSICIYIYISIQYTAIRRRTTNSIKPVKLRAEAFRGPFTGSSSQIAIEPLCITLVMSQK